MQCRLLIGCDDDHNQSHYYYLPGFSRFKLKSWVVLNYKLRTLNPSGIFRVGTSPLEDRTIGNYEGLPYCTTTTSKTKVADKYTTRVKDLKNLFV